MAFLNAIGDWLEGSGWVAIIIKSNINTPGRADSLLKGNNPKKCRYAFQVTIAALSMLLKDSFANQTSDLSIKDWMKKCKSTSSTFSYWLTLIEMISVLLMFIKSVRISDFEMFIQSLELIVPWMFALDHTNYARLLPVFINDLKLLQIKHPKIHKEFLEGRFTIRKTFNKFSNIGIDQAHEQNNKLVKIEGGPSTCYSFFH